MKKIRADWANLPFDILLLIGKRLRFLDDHIRLDSVCKSWLRTLLFKDKENCLPSLYPMLMLMDDEFGQRKFYSPFNGGGICKSRLPEIHGKKYWGSSNGWLITLDPEHHIHLFNPLSRHQIQLPMLVSEANIPMDEEFYNKIILLDDSCSGDLVVVAIYSDNRMVASRKPGAESWMPLQCRNEENHFFCDVVCFGEKFYMVTRGGYVFIRNSNGLLLQSIFLPWILNPTYSSLYVTYIVNLGGQLYLITRSSGRWKDDPTRKKTYCFKVFKLDEENRKCEDVVSLGAWSIFIGSNNSFAVSCIEYPECKSNCIYFTDHHLPQIGSSYDTGVYNLEDGTIKPLFRQDRLSLKQDEVPVWVKPVW